MARSVPSQSETPDVLRARAVEAMEKWFGFDGFRGGQEEVVLAILEGRDVLTVMPTGGGKSLCYQLPALIMEGVTLVVSPLIALMKDQVDALETRGIPATVINSMVDWPEQQRRLDAMRSGGYKLVYIAPERFRSQVFLNALAAVPVRMMAIDEAHCLSQWGHDFRPDYLRLGEARKKIGMPPVAAFTATATPLVRNDIRTTLALADPFELVSGFARDNLAFHINHVGGKADKIERLLEIIREWKTGIIYCSTRKSVEDVGARLRKARMPVVEYHAGMDDKARQRAQDEFIERHKDIAVATNAFGMGIDRADVRFVVHWELPGSVEAWYQEAGRAGRDGKPGHCEMLFNYADTRTQEFFIEGANPGEKTIRQVYQALRDLSDNSHEVHLSIEELTEYMELRNGMAISSSIAFLSRAGVIQRFDVPGRRKRGTRLLNPELRASELAMDGAALREKERRDRARLDSVVSFAYSNHCRQGWVLDYFGEKHAPSCGRCDACLAKGGGGARPGTLREETWLRMALSGVARCCRKEDGRYLPRFGRRKIIAMLVGSKSADLEAGGLNTLSTYGLLKEAGEDYTRDLFDVMEKAGLVVTETAGEYPLLGLTAEGEAVMRGEKQIQLDWPGSDSPKPAPKRPSGAKKSAKSGGAARGRKGEATGHPRWKKGGNRRGKSW